MQTSLPKLALTWLAATLGGQQSLESDTGHLRLLTREGTQEIRSKDGDLIRRTKLEVRQLRVIEFPRGDGLVGLWKEGTPGTQHYVVQRAATGFQRSREADYRIHLKGGRFDPLDEVPDCKRPDLTESGNLHLVQFVCPPLAEFRAELEQLGAKVYQFIPAHTRIVRMDEETAIQVKALPFVRWIGPYQANYRLERELLSGLKSSSVDSPIHCSVQVFESGPAQKERVALKIKRLGGRIVTQFSEGYQLQALLDRSQLLQVVALDEVMFIDRVAPREAAMNKVRIAGGANDLESLEGFTGQGVRGEVLDTNVRQTHAAFQHHPLIIHGTVQGSSDHGTKTTGIIFGDGTGEPSARGLLPEGQGIFADFAFLANRYAHTAELLQAPYNAVFQSNSWGSSQTTIYNSTSNQLDNILFDMDITVIQAQGNFGSQASLSQAWSKNVISVGALYHNNTTQLDDDSWSGGASTGPAADGRIKPDLCFWYDSIWTTDNENDTDYDGSFCCTSAATACVAGYVGLVQQMWSEGIFGNFPVGTTVFERRARASTVRALLINSATQYPFNGMNHDRSRTHQGWGIPDVKTLHDNRDSMLIVDESELLSEGGAASYQVSVLPGQSALKATMVFLDPPGTTSASQHRINDLSLKLTAPDSTEYWGNKGLLSGNWSTSGGGLEHHRRDRERLRPERPGRNLAGGGLRRRDQPGRTRPDPGPRRQLRPGGQWHRSSPPMPDTRALLHGQTDLDREHAGHRLDRRGADLIHRLHRDRVAGGTAEDRAPLLGLRHGLDPLSGRNTLCPGPADAGRAAYHRPPGSRRLGPRPLGQDPWRPGVLSGLVQGPR